MYFLTYLFIYKINIYYIHFTCYLLWSLTGKRAKQNNIHKIITKHIIVCKIRCRPNYSLSKLY